MKKGIVSILLIQFLLGFCMAQDFEVAPVIVNFDANPGEIQKAEITIRNHANIKQSYTITLGDFIIDEKGDKKRIPAGQSEKSCANWTTVTPSFIQLNPNEEKNISVLMTVPKDGYDTRWCLLYVQTAEEQTENPVDKQLQTGIRVKPRIAVLINQSPKSNSNYSGKIYDLKDITTAEDSTYQYQVTVENTGDKILEASVQLYLANLSTATEKKYPSQMQRVYPGEKRTFILSLPKGEGSGKHALAAILDYGHGSDLEGTQIMIDL
ncbi:COG1470 family protein [Parvicella tangerina]|uniref:CARDB domain-containing protein n=1 Tax=Parvicella tangerina TaxID=2829795 RepID=A0A916JK31_9FLAO|nr:DUF916 domain-containing protein [Parvicella tangerina]CAG5077795.1 hypothetical protein CRYO30217_00484 [Parvicella tangerina]